MVGFGTKGEVKVQAVSTGAETSAFVNEAQQAFRFVREEELRSKASTAQVVEDSRKTLRQILLDGDATLDEIANIANISRRMLRNVVTLAESFNVLFGTTIETKFIALGLTAEAQLRSLYASLAAAAATPWGWQTIPLILSAFTQVMGFMAWLKIQQDITMAAVTQSYEDAFDRLMEVVG